MWVAAMALCVWPRITEYEAVLDPKLFWLRLIQGWPILKGETEGSRGASTRSVNLRNRMNAEVAPW